jgi:NitT/TauT family transport system substrate-binding protein
VHRLMRQYGVTESQVTLIEMAPPDMPAAMGAGAVDAYATGEPWGAKAERDGTGRVLHWTRQDWPDYICCVLAVRVDHIATTRPMIQYLVDNVMSAGVWLDRDSVNRVLAANVASRPQYFNTDSTLIRYVLEHPRDRVTYGDLRLIRSQLDSLMELGRFTGIINHPIPYETYTDESFIRHHHNITVNLDSARHNE